MGEIVWDKLVLDGAFGTELERLGVDIKHPLWSSKALLDSPELVKQVHASYLEAGADIIESSSYQATVAGFVKQGYSVEEATHLFKLSLRLAKEVRDTIKPEALVAASLGPYGAFLANGSEYTGAYRINYDELKGFHYHRIELIIEEGPDILALETVPTFEEARALAEVLEELPSGIPSWISFACKDAVHTTGGDSLQEIAAFLDAAKSVTGIGINCTSPEYVEPLIRSVRQETAKPIIVYPNLGEVYDGVTKTWSGGKTPFIDYVPSWLKAGANVIGGCCRTTPDTIRQVAKRLT